MKTETETKHTLIEHIVGLARVCSDLALDIERKDGASCGAAWYRGKAAGYIAAARSIKNEEGAI